MNRDATGANVALAGGLRDTAQSVWDALDHDQRASLYAHTAWAEYADIVADLPWYALTDDEHDALERVVWLNTRNGRLTLLVQ